MAMVHEFVMIEGHLNLDQVFPMQNKIKISDEIMQYINDSLNWFDSKWNGGGERSGLSLLGYSLIQGDNIRKMGTIIESWMKLFSNGPDVFYLTGDFLLDEQAYQKDRVDKKDLLDSLQALSDLCLQAIKGGKDIVHLGI